jgi:FADH2 O2-dependent halogenase
MAMLAKRLGHSVVLLEKGMHPRFAIGESSTPLTNLMLEELANTYDLDFLRNFSKWGAWQENHPDIACGLKRGFTFLKHDLGAPFEFREDRSNELLVAASPNDRIADTHWYRPDFDQFLQQRAVELGVEYLDKCEVNAITWNKISGARNADYWGRGVTLNVVHGNSYHDLKVKLVIDASGPRGCLWNLLELDEMPAAKIPETQSVFSHFRGVEKLKWPTEETPYPPESAAVHHVFDGGWIWVLRFNNGLTSAGVVARRELAEEWDFTSGEPGWRRALERLPTVRDLFKNAEAVEPFRFMPRISFRSLQVSGPGWVMLPSAAGFADPLLSTGFPLTLLGIKRLAGLLQETPLDGQIACGIAAYSEQTVCELDVTARLIAALYWNMKDFALFTALTKLYFAAVSFAETRQRLGKQDSDHGFLLLRHPVFGPSLRRCVDRAISHGQTNGTRSESMSLQASIQEAIKPVDVVGLGNDDRRNWFPADNTDLFASCNKLGASREDVEQLIRRCGLGRW